MRDLRTYRGLAGRDLGLAGPEDITLHVDGAAKGNPGPAGIGVKIEVDGQVIAEHAGNIGTATNNVAEYHALIKGLQMAQELGALRVVVVSDSELMVRQLNGVYRVKNAALISLYREAKDMAAGFDRFRIRHVLRGENRDADRLANEGILKGK